MTTYVASSDDKVVKLTTFCFLSSIWQLCHHCWQVVMTFRGATNDNKVVKLITFCHNQAVVRPIKYECDSQDLTGTHAKLSYWECFGEKQKCNNRPHFISVYLYGCKFIITISADNTLYALIHKHGTSCFKSSLHSNIIKWKTWQIF